MAPLHYGNNKPKYIRYLIYVAVITLAAVLQNSAGGISDFFGARVFYVLPACVCIAMFEREVAAAVFGAYAGVLLDVSSANDGFNAVVLLLLCATASLLISHFMRNNILTAFVIGAGAVFVYTLVYIIVNLFVCGAGLSVKHFFTFYLASGVCTLVFIPVFYFLTAHLYDAHKTTDE